MTGLEVAYDTRRRVTGLELNMAALLGHFGIAPTTSEEVTAAMGEDGPDSGPGDFDGVE